VKRLLKSKILKRYETEILILNKYLFRYLCFYILAGVLFFLCSYQSGHAKEPKKEQKKIEAGNPEAAQKFIVGDFIYTSENKRDPFEPLYLLKIRQDKVAGASKRGYELEELKLVGVLKTGNNRYAMMENMQGKGITFKKGDFLNNNLWISDIIDSKVILSYKLKGEIKRIELDIPTK
jgi:Tfp pilus assembly protein PilP